MPSGVFRSDTVADNRVALRAIEPAARKPTTPSAAANITATALLHPKRLLPASMPRPGCVVACILPPPRFSDLRDRAPDGFDRPTVGTACRPPLSHRLLVNRARSNPDKPNR